ncbi:MAG: hypothetical protein GY838_00630 [bacterium]|nr:hypothetical protein [bacterium]
MRIPIVILTTSLLVVSFSASAQTFFDERTVFDREARDWFVLGAHTIVRTEDQLLLIDWSAPDGERETVLRSDYPLPTAVSPGLVAWGGTDDRGHAVAGGTYFVRVTTPAGRAHGSCTIIR